jgi:hypothetical protein
MIDVNKITSTLAKLGDPQLQQYAQMHKNDPYIMSLAMSESNRRKELRAASQAPAQQEQPKVVDSEIARMGSMQNASPAQLAQMMQMLEAKKQAEHEEFTGGRQAQPMPEEFTGGRQAQPMPEDQGIGQLPAGNMDFAGGGIIAFADGGDVPRYSGEFGSFIGGSTMDGFMPSGAQQDLASQATDLATSERTRTAAAAKIAELRKRVNELQFTAPELIPSVNAQIAALTASASPKATPSPTDPNFRRQPDPRAAGANTFADSVKAVSAAPKVDTTRRAAPVAGPVAGPQPTPASGPTDIDALQQKYFGGIDQEIGGLRNARAGLVAGIKDLTEQNLAATKADIEKRGDVYKGREERLAKQEKGLEGMGDKYMGLALLQAGAAMMTTPGGLGVALGKGVQVGSERYVAGLDKIEAAKSKFAEARDRLDDLRINRDDMNNKDIRAAEKEARESKLKGEELLYNGLVSDLGIKQKNVSEIFRAASDDLKTTRTIDAERANTLTRESGANARAAAGNRNNQLEMLQALQADPKLMTAYRTMQGKNEDVMGQYNDFLKANPALAMDPKAAFTQFLMTKSAFAQLGASPVTEKAAGPVRKQP